MKKCRMMTIDNRPVISLGGLNIILMACLTLFSTPAHPYNAPDTDGTASVTPDTVIVESLQILEGLEAARSLAQRFGRELIVIKEGQAGGMICRIRMEDPEPVVMEKEAWNLPDHATAIAMALEEYPVVVSPENGQAYMFDDHMRFIRRLTVPSWVDGAGIFHPDDVTVNEIGEIFILDSPAKRIYMFNANGDYLLHLNLDQMDHPVALSYAEESLFIADRGREQVHVLATGGHELAVIGTFPDLSRVRVFNRMIWILSGEVIHLFDISGDLVGNWMLEFSGESLRDIVVIEKQIFLLTSGSLYYAGSVP